MLVTFRLINDDKEETMQQHTRKSRLTGATAIALGVVLVLGSCSSARGSAASGGDEDEVYTIGFSHVTTTNTPKGAAAEKFKEILEASSDGRIEVELYPNSSLYGDKDELQALQSNSIQMIAPASAKFTTLAPQLQLLDLPFLFESSEDIAEIASRDSVVGKAIFENEDLRAAKIKPLGLWDNGFKQMGANVPIRAAADMAGLSFRIQPADVLVSQFETWDAIPSILAFAEVYSALEQGVINGQENTWSNMETQSMHTVQDFITESNHGYIGYIPAINNDFFESLPDDLQQLVLDAVDESSVYNREIAAEVNEEAKQAIIAEGSTEIIQLTDAERDALMATVIPSVWEEYSEVLGPDIVAELLANRD
ncbi:DctP family TRAP transporter solute-binding subunit [Cryobacterium levicorallinum]|uniref:DctP family TRAP transporter solute-binding subunit n=2 Tax=Cryobacterium levicorallinum TaxID=995038 RepID=A0A4R8VUQ0_9MICO|nr:DctP family TRAP transporter solute-binding subunit [Cryobacterium levicorallinum]GEP25897.1 C4-dicarboxylate ABC transporter [Cryobacterium levicorallinum]